MQSLKGYVYAKDYPYIANQSNCSAKKHHIRKLKRNVEIVNYFKSNEEQLMLMLQNGPVSLGVAAGASLYHYNSGNFFSIMSRLTWFQNHFGINV